MPAPYDYTIQAVNPLQSFLQGVQTVDTLQKREQEIAAQKAAQQQLQQRQALMNQFQTKAAEGKLQVSDFDTLLLIDPANHKAWSERAAQLSTEKKDSAFNTLSPVYAALYNQQPDIAKARLQTELVAAENAQDASRASQIKAALQLIETPEGQQAALLDVGTTMFGLNPDRMKSLQESLNTQGTARAARRKAEAEAGEAEAKVKLVGTPTDAQMADWWTKATPAQQKAYLAVQNAKKPPATVVKVENIMDKTGMAEVAKLLPTYQEKMMSSVAQIEKLPEYKAALKNAITGPFAEQRLTGARIANMFGFTGDTALKDTATLVQGLSQQVLDSRSLLTGQGAISNFEQQVLEKAKSGNINMSAKELETLFNVAERSANASYENNERILQAARKRGSQTAEMLLETVPKPSNRVTVDGKTYTRPAQMTDAQWSAYKQSVGAQ